MTTQTETKNKKTSSIVLQVALLAFVIGLPLASVGAYGPGGFLIAGAFITAIVGLAMKDSGR